MVYGFLHQQGTKLGLIVKVAFLPWNGNSFFIRLLCFPTSNIGIFFLSINERSKKKKSVFVRWFFFSLPISSSSSRVIIIVRKTHPENNHKPGCLFWFSVMNSMNNGLHSVCVCDCCVTPPTTCVKCVFGWRESKDGKKKRRQGNEVAWKGHILLEIGDGKDINIS